MALPNMAMIPSGYKPTKLYSVLPTPSYGSELVTNGNFATDSDWSKGTGWTISGGSLNASSATAAAFQQNTGIVVGKTYKVTYTISNYISGSVRIELGSANVSVGIIRSANGTYTEDIEALGDETIYFDGISAFTGSIDNVSVQEVLVGNADFDVTRATPATRVNQYGLIETPEFILSGELVTNGDFSNGSTDWTIDNLTGASSNITNGVLNIVSDGALTQADQSNVMIIGKQYKVTLDVIATNGAKLANSSGSNIYDTSTVGTKVFYIIAVNSSFYLKRRAGVTDVTIDNVSVVEVERNNIPRLDYTDGGCPVLLTEPQSTNLVEYSEDFSQGYWTKQSGIIPTYNTTETLSPDGTYNATKFVGNGTTGVFKSSISVSGVVSRSFYLKSVTETTTVVFKEPNTNVPAPIPLTVTNQWQRFEMIGNNGSSFQGLQIDDIPSDGLYMWGAQLENLPYSTSIIPTNGSTVTRNQDLVNNAGTSATYNSVEGVLFVEIAALANDGVSRNICLSDNTNSHRVLISYSTTSNQIQTFHSNGINTVNFTLTVTDATDFNKIAFKYKENDFALWVNGVEVATDTSGGVNSANTFNNLKFENASGSSDFYGKTSQVQVYNTALSNFDLLNLTSNATGYATYETMRTSLNFNIQ